MTTRRFLPLLLLTLTACAGFNAHAEEDEGDEPTLKSLRSRTLNIQKQAMPEGQMEKSIEGYRTFLQSSLGGAMRREALRRLADRMIEQLEKTEEAAAEGKPAEALIKDASYENAIKLYNDALKAYPNYPGNDHILYQLARAYESNGQPKQALWAMDSIVKNHPHSSYIAEIHFRRAELAFLTNDFDKAITAYESVIQKGPAEQFYLISIYKAGWSYFKKRDYPNALNKFIGLLNTMTAEAALDDLIADVPTFNAGQREMYKDTLRVIGISMTHQDDPIGYLGRYLDTLAEQPRYDFKIYESLAGLYQYQDLHLEAANVYQAFNKRYPGHPQAPFFQVIAIESYKKARQFEQARNASVKFATLYGFDSKFWDSNRPVVLREQLTPYLRTYLNELSLHYHAEMQKNPTAENRDNAIKWYRAYLTSFPNDQDSARINFLLAELLYESGNYSAAAQEYNKTAYNYGPHEKAREAAYAAILAYDKQRENLSGEERKAWEENAVANALHFAKVYPKDERIPAVLTKAAQDLYAVEARETAVKAAQVVLNLDNAKPEMKRAAYLVLGHTNFEAGKYAHAEKAYASALQTLSKSDPEHQDVLDRLAASIYKQAEAARDQKNLRGAIREFQRLAEVAPASSLRHTAEYDAAAAMLALKDWAPAIKILERLRNTEIGQRYGQEITQKLTVAYLETGQNQLAAGELLRLSSYQGDAEVQREAVWRSAELYEKASDLPGAIQAFESYVQRFPTPVDANIEAQYKLAQLNKSLKQHDRYIGWLKYVIDADQKAGAAATTRTRFLAGSASMALADMEFDRYREVRIVEPVKENLARKKELMQQAVNAYGRSSEYNIAELTTAATYNIAEIYRDFGSALLKSERPKGLDSDEREMYDLMLEEQAFPFEEKAIGLHEKNAERVRSKIYDKWVKLSYQVLAEANPGRYKKIEKVKNYIEILN
ncbi:MAG: tetratricopeptide repeat protein [Pseudomonadota bacterium]